MPRTRGRTGSRVVLIAAAFLASCATSFDRRVEQIVLQALPRLVGPADSYAVNATGVDPGAQRIGELRVTGQRVRRERSPVVDRVDLVLTDVLVDQQARRVASIGRADVTLYLTASDLTGFLRAQEWVEDPQVRLEAPADVVVAGRLQVPGAAFLALPDGELRARMVPRHSQLLVRVSALRLGDRQVPAFARAILEQAINPLFDTAPYAVPSQIDRAAVEGERLVLKASGIGIVPSR